MRKVISFIRNEKELLLKAIGVLIIYVVWDVIISTSVGALFGFSPKKMVNPIYSNQNIVLGYKDMLQGNIRSDRARFALIRFVIAYLVFEKVRNKLKS